MKIILLNVIFRADFCFIFSWWYWRFFYVRANKSIYVVVPKKKLFVELIINFNKNLPHLVWNFCGIELKKRVLYAAIILSHSGVNDSLASRVIRISTYCIFNAMLSVAVDNKNLACALKNSFSHSNAIYKMNWIIKNVNIKLQLRKFHPLAL